MIKVTVKTGPYAGRTREIMADVLPQDLFAGFLRHGWEWEVDYSQAAEAEAFEWGRQEMGARMSRAQSQRKPIRFLGRDYFDAQEAEDAISSSSRMVFIKRDDAECLEIGAEGYEQ